MIRASIKKVGSPGVMKDMIYINLSALLLVIVFISSLSWNCAYAQNSAADSLADTYIIEGDEWSYLKGLQKSPMNWYSPDKDVSSWHKGTTGFGYGTSLSKTNLEDMQGNYLTVYARTEFYINNPATAGSMTLSVVCDGPFIAFLNGVEMIRTKTFQLSTPDQPIGVEDVEQFNVSGFIHELNPGKNVLALQCDNDDLNSEDFSFIPVFEILEKGRDNNDNK